MRAVFSLAKKLAPCIIFIDEVDNLLKTRNGVNNSVVFNVKIGK